MPRDRLRDALGFVIEVLRSTDDAAHVPSTEVRGSIETVGEWETFTRIRGTWSHHYPICVRRVQPDDTLISMASCHGMEEQDWYAISLITFTEPRTDFEAVARLLAVVMAARFGARLHWGKWFPLGGSQVEDGYPGLGEFRSICEEGDPGGAFRNEFVQKTLFGSDG